MNEIPISCYNENDMSKSSRILLLPASCNRESSVISGCGVLYLPIRATDKNLILVRESNKENLPSNSLPEREVTKSKQKTVTKNQPQRVIEYEREISKIDVNGIIVGEVEDGDLSSDSVRSQVESLGWNVKVLYINSSTNMETISRLIKEELDKEKSYSFAFMSNLTSNLTNQEEVNRADDELIQAIKKGDISKIPQYMLVLRLFAMVVKDTNNLDNVNVVCYSDNLLKRTGWSTEDIDPQIMKTIGSLESYCAITVDSNFLSKDKNKITRFDTHFLVSYSLSYIVSRVVGSPHPKMPSWSNWNKRKEGCYVTTYNSNFGNHNNLKDNTVNNIVESSKKVPIDGLNRSNMWSTKIYVHIVQPENEWRIVNSKTISSINVTGIGFRIVSPVTGYIKDFIVDRPIFRNEYPVLMNNLSLMIGLPADYWRSVGLNLSFFNIKTLDICLF